MVSRFFFDAYAIIEILKQNKNYEKFISIRIVTNTLHLAEAYYYLLKTYDEKTADVLIHKIDISIKRKNYHMLTA